MMNHVEGHIKKKIVRFGSQDNLEGLEYENEDGELIVNKKGNFYW